MRMQGTNTQDGTAAVRYGRMSFAGIFPLVLAGSLGISERGIAQDPPPDTIKLTGVVRDFTSSHPDFGITDPLQLGQYTNTVAPILGFDGTPFSTGTGWQVLSPWTDKDGNTIMPYGDRGLPGGHFDIDVYDTAPSVNELYHEHQFDDTYNVTYVDIANDPNLLFDTVVGGAYPNDLRVSMMNVNNGGGGTYTFQAAGAVKTGITANWIDRVFTPADLTQLRVNFVSLAALSAQPSKECQNFPINRNGALSIRMYDVTTDALVYELTVYHHGDGTNFLTPPPPAPAVGADACGLAFSDTTGTFGAPGTGAVTDSTTFNQWFKDVPGANVSGVHDFTMQRDGVGVYSHFTDAFFPIDSMLYGNSGDLHNNYFTYTFSAYFKYSQCADQFFEFQSNDDVWVFINSALVLDLSGVATPEKQYVSMDRLNLVDGEEYTLKFFYAHRRESPLSVFNLRTSLELHTLAADLPPTSGLFD